MVLSAELPDTRLKESCPALAQLAGVGGGGPAKVSYSEKCPANPLAVCKHFLGQPVDYYYYRRDADLLEKTRKGCGQTGGTWWAPWRGSSNRLSTLGRGPGATRAREAFRAEKGFHGSVGGLCKSCQCHRHLS